MNYCLNHIFRKTIDFPKEGKGDCPKIEVIQVIFKHTYDEQNWSVLMERWSNLKAHLQGIIIPEGDAKNKEEHNLIKEINEMAPDFRP